MKTSDTPSDVVRQPAAIMVATVALILLSMVIGSEPARAQTGALGTIHGTVSDTSAAALPGVTVTITSPVLQVGRAMQVTQPDGAYRLAICRSAPRRSRSSWRASRHSFARTCGSRSASSR